MLRMISHMRKFVPRAIEQRSVAAKGDNVMINIKHAICGAGFLLLSAGAASAAPAFVVTDLNVRAGESTAYPVIGVLPGGSTVDVSGCGDGWCYVPSYGGFASASYLNIGAAAYGAVVPGYVAPSLEVVVPRPTYRSYYWYHDHDYRPARRAIRRDIRQDRREDRREVRQERREDRREVRQDRRQRREIRQNRNERREVRQERRERRADRRN
jgi:uncharacterized protein YraI